MKYKERMIFQNNKLGYALILLYVVFNTIYTISTLNSMSQDSSIGVFVMLSIILLLVGFFAGVKVRMYSFSWGVFAIFLGLFQFIRPVMTPTNLEGFVAVLMILFLYLSGAFCLAGAIVSIRNSLIRKAVLAEREEL